MTSTESSDPPDGEETEFNASEFRVNDQEPETDPDPSVSWLEDHTEDGYHLSLRPEHEGADEIVVKTESGRVVEEIRSNALGTYFDVAGLRSGNPTASEGDVYEVYYVHDDEERHLTTYTVGSQTEPEPTHLDEIIGGTGEDLREGGYTEREFTYEVFGARYRYTGHVPQNLLDYYERRHRIDDYGAYVSDPFDDQYLQSVADAFVEGADTERRALEHARAFVQQLEYTRDRVSQGTDEYPQFPVETMFAQQGDCEDTAILLSAIYRQMGYGTVLLGLWDENHMGLGVAGDESLPGTYYEHQGTRYYYVETTAEGWEIGEMPNDLTETEAEIIPVDQHPALVFSWITGSRSGGVSVDMMVNNRGQTTASGVRLRAQFETRSGRTVASDTEPVGTVTPNSIENVSLSLDVPEDTELRGRFQVLTNGTLYDEATTDWYSPNGL